MYSKQKPALCQLHRVVTRAVLHRISSDPRKVFGEGLAVGSTREVRGQRQHGVNQHEIIRGLVPTRVEPVHELPSGEQVHHRRIDVLKVELGQMHRQVVADLERIDLPVER